MPNMLDNYGVSAFAETKEVYKRFLTMISREGKSITGYYGTPYYRLTLGDMEFWLSTRITENGKIEVTGLSTHCQGSTVWDLIHAGVDLTSKVRKIGGWGKDEVIEQWGNQDPGEMMNIERVMLFYVKNGEGGFLPIHLVNADVLPSFIKGDKIKVQVMALPVIINYYANDEACDDALLNDQNGIKWEIAEGSLIPLDYIRDHRTGQSKIDEDYASNSFVVFRARVKALLNGCCQGENGEQFVTFIRCVAETAFGELEFHHSYEQVPEEMRDNIKVGSVISGICMLSGDAAILGYENGAIKDFDHDTALLRNTIVNGEPERLRSVLSDDAIYETDAADVLYVGKEEIIDRFTYVVNELNRKQTKVFAHHAVLVETDHMEYPDGTRCLALAYNEDYRFESVLFIDVNEGGLITRIKVSEDLGYQFKVVNQKEIMLPFDNMKNESDLLGQMVLRARKLGLINPSISDETVLNEIPDFQLFDERGKEGMNALQKRARTKADNTEQIDAQQDVENIVGYLFAKAVEMSLYRKMAMNDETADKSVPFCIEEALEGEFTTTLQGKTYETLIGSRGTGVEFLEDFNQFCNQRDLQDEDMLNALWDTMIFVQRLGQLAVWKLFRNQDESQGTDD